MTIVEQVNDGIKTAMKAKDQASLRTLRSIKSALLLEATSGSNSEVTDEIALKAINKLAKQRKDSLSIYEEQGREDLAVVEREELAILETFLPKQMEESQVREIIQGVITQTGASGMGDMGKVMGMAIGKIGTQADGKVISAIVRELLA